MFDWGDDTDSGWIGPYDSGEIVNSSHIWTRRGKYDIRVKAKDILDHQSDWSDPLQISLPKNKMLIRPIQIKFFENHLKLLQFLRIFF